MFSLQGMLVAQSLDQADPWSLRCAIARTFELLAPSFSDSLVIPFFKFLVAAEALGDRAPPVRKAMLSAGTIVIDIHGAKHLPPLISMFEDHLAQATPPTEAADHIKEAVVILFFPMHKFESVEQKRRKRLLKSLATSHRSQRPRILCHTWLNSFL